MDRGEWSRSRYWLCHFLHNRHVRAMIAFEPPNTPQPTDQATLRLFADDAGRPAGPQRLLIARAVSRHGDDPAYVQSLRLLTREQQYHGRLMAEMLRTAGGSEPMTSWGARLLAVIRRPFGIRFELSVLLLSEMLRVALLRLVPAEASASAVAVAAQVIRDRQAHLAFHAERLTLEYAEFNFISRNLRRLRLRLMFLTIAGTLTWRHRRLLRQGGRTMPGFIRENWRAFQATLEQMVPYHREALLAALLNQRDHPYAKPQHPAENRA